MKSVVTSKGQVTIPKALRERFGIEPGTQIDFAATDDGIRLRKKINKGKQSKVFGCLKAELEGRQVSELLEELRGPVDLVRLKGNKQ